MYHFTFFSFVTVKSQKKEVLSYHCVVSYISCCRNYYWCYLWYQEVIQGNKCLIIHFKLYLHVFYFIFICPKGPSVKLCYGTCCPTVCSALAKSCQLIIFKLVSPRLIFLGIMNGHDPKMILIEFEISRLKIKVTVTLNLKFLSTQLETNLAKRSDWCLS